MIEFAIVWMCGLIASSNKSDFYLLLFSTSRSTSHTSPAWSRKRISRIMNTNHNWDGERKFWRESDIEWERKREKMRSSGKEREFCMATWSLLYSSLSRPNADRDTQIETRSPSHFIRTSFQFQILTWSDVLHKQWTNYSEQKQSHRTTWRTSLRFCEWTAVSNA